MSKDPIEREVAEALIDAGIPFTDDQQDTLGLDFFIPRFDLYIECKFAVLCSNYTKRGCLRFAAAILVGFVAMFAEPRFFGGPIFGSINIAEASMASSSFYRGAVFNSTVNIEAQFTSFDLSDIVIGKCVHECDLVISDGISSEGKLERLFCQRGAGVCFGWAQITERTNNYVASRRLAGVSNFELEYKGFAVRACSTGARHINVSAKLLPGGSPHHIEGPFSRSVGCGNSILGSYGCAIRIAGREGEQDQTQPPKAQLPPSNNNHVSGSVRHRLLGYQVVFLSLFCGLATLVAGWYAGPLVVEGRGLRRLVGLCVCVFVLLLYFVASGWAIYGSVPDAFSSFSDAWQNDALQNRIYSRNINDSQIVTGYKKPMTRERE